MVEPLKLTIPGKAFLAGEYLALTGEGALVVAIEPRFSLIIREQKSSQPQVPFHPDSPAGLLWAQYKFKYPGLDMSFQDPHCGKGGWGGSTSEFALLYSFIHLWDLNSRRLKSFDWKSLLEDYQAITKNSGKTPSGADFTFPNEGWTLLF